MKLSVSNLGWSDSNESIVLGLLDDYEIDGLEIAPTRLVADNPFSRDAETEIFDKINLYKGRGLLIPSLQSIWFGRVERLFGSSRERELLLQHTGSVVAFAESISCGHIVLGSPKNRTFLPDDDYGAGLDFLRNCAEIASLRGVTIGIEPNPTLYGTNFINTAEEAFQLVATIGHKNLRVNYDLGAAIINKESIRHLEENLELVSHVHVSAPGLRKVEPSDELEEVAATLLGRRYTGWVSLEVKTNSIIDFEASLDTLVGAFRRIEGST